MPPSTRLAVVATLTTALLGQIVGAGESIVTIELIPGALSADDLSPDGRWIVGERLGFAGPYRYDTLLEEMTNLPSGASAVAVSDDGSVVLGTMTDPDAGVQAAGIWTESSGVWTSLGILDVCGSGTTGYELSGDGTVAVGLAWNGCSARGFRWTEATGMVELEGLANGNNRASAVSADGTVIGGFAQGSFSRTPAIWDGTTAAGELLDPPNGDVVGEVHGMSDDGTILLAEWEGDAVRWTESGGVELIGQGGVFGAWIGIPMDIADNGTVVGFDTILTSRVAWILEGGSSQMRTIPQFLNDNGLSAPPGATLEVCQAISRDGRRIIGHGAFSNAWMITIEPACPADVDGSGVIDFTDLLTVLSAWGPCAECPADTDGNGVVDFQDLLAVLAGWGECD